MEARVYRVYLFLPSLFSLSSAFQNVLSVSNVLESVVFSTYLCISLQELINAGGPDLDEIRRARIFTTRVFSTRYRGVDIAEI